MAIAPPRIDRFRSNLVYECYKSAEVAQELKSTYSEILGAGLSLNFKFLNRYNSALCCSILTKYWVHYMALQRPRNGRNPLTVESKVGSPPKFSIFK